MTLVLDTKVRMFGGFGPMEWKFHCADKRNDNLRRFLFTPRHSRDVPPWKFALKEDAICCYPEHCAPYGRRGICANENATQTGTIAPTLALQFGASVQIRKLSQCSVRIIPTYALIPSFIEFWS